MKSKLRLTSSSFNAQTFVPGAEGAAATGTTTAKTVIPFVPGAGTEAITDWSKTTAPVTTKPAEEKKTDKNTSPNKINLKSTGGNYEFRPGQKMNLDTIPETKAENKQEGAATIVPTKVEDKPVVENKRVEQLPPQPSDEFVEVMPKNVKKGAPRKYENLGAAKTEPRKEVQPAKKEEVKPAVETKKVEEPSPKKEAKPEAKEVEKKHEEKSFATPAKSEVKIEIIMMTRSQFADAVQRMTETLKDRRVPEGLERYRHREILNESLKKRTGGGGQDTKSSIYFFY